jgi:hypothetical protein
MTYSSDDLFHARRFNEEAIAAHEEEQRIRFRRLAQQASRPQQKAQPPTRKAAPAQRPAAQPAQPQLNLPQQAPLSPQQLAENRAFWRQQWQQASAAQPPQAPTPAPQGRPTRRPAPQQSTAPRYFSSDDTGLMVWSTKEYTCLQCGRAVWGVDFVDTVLQRGGANGADSGKNIGWLSRADKPDVRCDICGRKISG